MLELDANTLALFTPPNKKAEQKPEIAPPLPTKADTGRLAAIEARLDGLEYKFVEEPVAVSVPKRKPPETAEIFYSQDGRIKSFRMGKFGASVERDSDGRMRKVNIYEL